jgi:hypothetical protein
MAPAPSLNERFRPRANDKLGSDHPCRVIRGKVAHRCGICERIELLHEEFTVPALNGDRDWPGAARSQKRKRRQAGHSGAPSDRKAMRGGDADPDSGEAAWTDTHHDGAWNPPVEHPRKHWYQPLAMTAADDLCFGGEEMLPVKQCGGASSARCVDR